MTSHRRSRHSFFVFLSLVVGLSVTAIVIQRFFLSPAQKTPEFDYELVKLTDQLQKPSDQLILSREQILFWEPLRPDSKVVQAISKYHEQTAK